MSEICILPEAETDIESLGEPARTDLIGQLLGLPDRDPSEFEDVRGTRPLRKTWEITDYTVEFTDMGKGSVPRYYVERVVLTEDLDAWNEEQARAAEARDREA